MTAPRGFGYHVSDEQLATFAAIPWERRLDWLDEQRETLIRLASDETKARWVRLRRGEPIDAA